MTLIRLMTESDFPAVWEIVKDSKILDIHTPYTYWAQLNMFPTLMFVAESNSEIVGFVSGIGHFRKDSEAFIWQIGVSEKCRRQGVGMALLSRFREVAKDHGFTRLSLTIADDNPGSKMAFEKFAKAVGSQMVTTGATGTFQDHMKNEVIYEIDI
jgi:L-2,4-diaminobutyric acid acetyltransferase